MAEQVTILLWRGRAGPTSGGMGGGPGAGGGPAPGVLMPSHRQPRAGGATIWGNGGSDVLVGGTSASVIYAINPTGTGDSGGISYIYGGPGNDTIPAGKADDVIFGGGGTNTIEGRGPGKQIG